MAEIPKTMPRSFSKQKMFSFCICLLGLAMSAEAEAPPKAAVVIESSTAVPVDPLRGTIAGAGQATSGSQQFVVRGADELTRNSVAMLASEAREDLLIVTGGKNEWKVPINIYLFGKQGDEMPPRAVEMQLFYNESSYDLRVNVHLSRGIEQEKFFKAITSALIYERSLRKRPLGANDTPLMVPPWLVEGLREADDWRQNRADTKLYEALFQRGGVFKLSEVFEMTDRAYEDLDSGIRAGFRASAGALVMALLEQKDGKKNFNVFLDEVATYEGEMPGLLKKHFPGVNLSSNSLAKWWALHLAVKGSSSLDVYTVAETENELKALLKFQLHDAEGNLQEKPFANWPELKDLKPSQRSAAVRAAQQNLVRLSYRSFPSYRPLLANYQGILQALVQGKTDKLAERIKLTEETRTVMAAKALRSRDFLDWYEITQAREVSGSFDDYMRFKEVSKKRRTDRTDHISRCLDRMEQIFYRK